MGYYEIFIPVKTPEQDVLIYRLDKLGFSGFEETQNGLYAYIEYPAYDSKMFYETLTLFTHIDPNQVIFKTLPHQNWNELWEAHFQYQVIDDQILIKAPFHQVKKSYPYEILIEPQMAFGTGHHPTTAMMVRLLLQLDLKDQIVFDYGTGSGILAILAEKMGAREVFANDIQEDALRNARLNIAQNQCQSIYLSQEALPDFPPGSGYGIVLANITRNTILNNLNDLKKCLKSQGYLLVSGYLNEEAEKVNNAIEEQSFLLREKQQEEKWAAGLFQKLN